MLRVPYQEMLEQFERVLLSLDFSVERAKLCAMTFADNSRDGVYSHGLNNFPWFVDSVRRGAVVPAAEPELTEVIGVIERWDAHCCPGPVAAHMAMGRAMAIARDNAMGCATLKNTSHWMRGGTYGIQAAEAGFIGICWTNTQPLMPPWGSAQRRLGNNPLIMAVPHADGPIVMDMAMTQFSGGKRAIHERSDEPLPVPGGYDTEGNLTCDADAIRESGRSLPIGYWKGSSLALMLDLIGTVLSGGRSSHEIGKEPHERAVSQVFIAIGTDRLGGTNAVEAILADMLSAEPLDPQKPVRYPGQRMVQHREESMRLGVPVEEAIWEEVCAM